MADFLCLRLLILPVPIQMYLSSCAAFPRAVLTAAFLPGRRRCHVEKDADTCIAADVSVFCQGYSAGGRGFTPGRPCFRNQLLLRLR